MQFNLKKLLTIMYLKTYKDCYEYSELKELLGFSITQLKEFLEGLVDEGLVINDVSLKLTDKSINTLKDMGLFDVDFNTLMEEKTTISINSSKLTFDDIYIPKDFKL